MIELLKSDMISRWFSGTCGVHAFIQLKEQGKFFLSVGLLAVDGHMGEKGHFHTWDVSNLCLHTTVNGGLASFM
ncbi:hypothetical protein D8B26_003754 [Coccidioides posadasii str. Silveira]|uniref:uncharacterized protein n=1 Tax=Coccidioides posadasii (strain RMSCC 757 / Silveira) TaxID=443226 RepID=UPI001BF0D260|nr:hypothetical protein D8B26_003754 [Coccidioides posadasii str. Silveira]